MTADLHAITENAIAGSRSLFSHKAYEMKFVIQDAQIGPVLDWARANLALDQHADRSSGAYNVTSLYFDTNDWDVYNASSGYKLSKYRVRRYDSEPFIFLELKSRRNYRISKYRVRVNLSELAMLKDVSAQSGWAGRWFSEGIWRRQLKPGVLVAYRRAAFVGESQDGAPRLTVDTRLSCAPAVGYSFAHPKQTNFFTGQGVLELKYHGRMPASFWTFMRNLKLQPAGISKYRIAVAAMALAKIP